MQSAESCGSGWTIGHPSIHLDFLFAAMSAASYAEEFERIKLDFDGEDAEITQNEFLALNDAEAQALIDQVTSGRSKARLHLFRSTGNMM